MSLEKTVVEVVVPDVHRDATNFNKPSAYDALARVLDDGVTRVFLVGDLREKVNQSIVERLYPANMLEKVIRAQQAWIPVFQEHYQGSIDVFKNAMQQGNVPEEHVKLHNAFAGISQEYESLKDKAMIEESKEDYQWHEKKVKEIRAMFPNIPLFGVEGNHDTKYVRHHVKSVDWLRVSQSLANQGIIGSMCCHPENGGEMNANFNGPEPSTWPELDDHPSDHKQSPLYNHFKDYDVQLVVTHSGPDVGPVHEPYPASAGITQLVKDKKPVVYEGHIHKGIIYWSPDTGWIIRPGTKHVAKVWRKANNIEKIQLFSLTSSVDSYRQAA